MRRSKSLIEKKNSGVSKFTLIGSVVTLSDAFKSEPLDFAILRRDGRRNLY